MTHNEIIRSYKNAADQQEQIVILSQLTLKSEAEIIKILNRNGIEVEKKVKLVRLRNNAEQHTEILNEIQRLSESGYTIRQISEAVNMSYDAVIYLANRYCDRKQQKRARWTKKQILELIRLREQECLSWLEIAKKTNRSSSGVRRKYYKCKKRQNDVEQ